MLASDYPTQSGSPSGSLNGRPTEKDRESRMVQQLFVSAAIRYSKGSQQAMVVET